MKNLKKVIGIFLILTLVLSSFAACGGGGGSTEQGSTDDVYELSWAGISSTEAIDTLLAQRAADAIEEQTDGHVKITVYPASQLGDYTQVYEEIMQGTIDMGLFTMTSDYDKFGEALYIPYLVDNAEDFEKYYGEGAYISEKYNEYLAEYGVKALGYWPAGFIGIGFAKMDDTTRANLFNFDVQKSTLVRSPALETMLLVIKDGMKYNTTTIAYADLYTSLQTGVCDAWYGGSPYLNLKSFVEVIDTFVDYKILPDTYACIINEDTFNSLPEEYQTIVNDCVTEALSWGLDEIVIQEEESLQGLVDAGVEVIVPTDEERAAMKEHFIENIWPVLGEEYYGTEYMDKLAELAAE